MIMSYLSKPRSALRLIVPLAVLLSVGAGCHHHGRHRDGYRGYDRDRDDDGRRGDRGDRRDRDRNDDGYWGDRRN
jgi:hypothetical protein